jgi:hypothetical protein
MYKRNVAFLYDSFICDLQLNCKLFQMKNKITFKNCNTKMYNTHETITSMGPIQIHLSVLQHDSINQLKSCAGHIIG